MLLRIGEGHYRRIGPARGPPPRYRCSSTTARASIARPSPTGPSFSAVLAFTLTWPGCDRQGLRDARAHGLDVRRQLRRLRDHGAVDVADLPALGRARGAPPRPAAPIESAPAKRSSVSGKCRPMSPSAAAPSRASVIACSSTSASEWPSRPAVVRDLDAAEDQLAARHQRMHVPAFADADVAGHGVAARLSQHGFGQREVLRIGHLEVLRAARHQQRLPGPCASIALASSVTASPRALQRLEQHADAEHLRRLRQPLVGAGQRGGHAAVLRRDLERVGQRMRQQAADLVVLRRRRSARSISAGVTRQRAASCTSTQSCVDGAGAAQLAQAVAHAGGARGAAAGAPPAPEVRQLRSKKPSPGATTTSVRGDARARAAKAASVCQTIGWPATRSYCLGPAVPARLPVPAQGISAKKRAGVMCVAGTSWRWRPILESRRTPLPVQARGVLHFLAALSWTYPSSPPASASPCRARPARPTRCCWPALAEREKAAGRAHRHRHGRRQRRAAPDRRDRVLRARPALRAVPRLGDAALRHLLAAPGPDQRAPGHAVAHPRSARPTWCWCRPPPRCTAWRRRPSWPATPSTSRSSRSWRRPSSRRSSRWPATAT